MPASFIAEDSRDALRSQRPSQIHTIVSSDDASELLRFSVPLSIDLTRIALNDMPSDRLGHMLTSSLPISINRISEARAGRSTQVMMAARSGCGSSLPAFVVGKDAR